MTRLATTLGRDVTIMKTPVLHQLGRAPITLMVVLSSLTAMLPALSGALAFDRSAIADGQWWRLVTGHLTHWSADHLFWDVLVFACIGALCEVRRPGQYLACLIGATIAISAVVWWWQPELMTYRGLSAIDSALFVMLAVDLFDGHRRRRNTMMLVMCGGLLAAFVGKTLIEVLSGSGMFVDTQAGGFVPIPAVHLAGAAVGLAIAILGCATARIRLHDGVETIASHR